MILLDAYALIAFLVDEPAAPEVGDLLRDGACSITTVNLAETVDIATRARGLDPVDVRGVVEILVASRRLGFVELSANVAWRAAALRRTHYTRRTCEISLADSFLLATAGSDDSIATADPSVVDVARAEGLTVAPLPDSSGRRP